MNKILLFMISLTFSALTVTIVASALYNLDGNYDVMKKMTIAEYDVIISILLKASKECSVF